MENINITTREIIDIFKHNNFTPEDATAILLKVLVAILETQECMPPSIDLKGFTIGVLMLAKELGVKEIK